MILLVVNGNRPFHDQIYTIQSDGSNLQPLLIPKSGRSYMYASGNSLTTGLVVTVHETASGGQIEDHLYLYRHATGEWQRLLKQKGNEGAGFMSPDDTQSAFIFAPESSSQLRIWLANFTTGATRKLTNEDNEEAWDGYLSWRPDGQEITFLRLRVTSEGIVTALMRVATSGGNPTILLDSKEGVVAACYSQSGSHLATLTKNGLEIVELSTTQRKIILPWSSLPNAQFRAGGLIWSRIEDRIAFALFNNESKEYELWTVASDGSNAKKIYSHSESQGRLSVSSFIQR